MKVKDGFVLRSIADEHFVMPTGHLLRDFNNMLVLNESSVLLWQELVAGTTVEALIAILTNTYDVSYEIAHNDVIDFLSTMRDAGIIDE